MPHLSLEYRTWNRAAVAFGLTALLATVGCYEGVSLGDAVSDDEMDPGSSDDDADPDSSPDPSDDGPTQSCNGGPGVSARPLARLTPLEYQNTMRDLLGDPDFVAEYDSLEDPISEKGVRQLRNGAETAMQRRDSWTQPVFDCDLDQADDACAASFIDTFVPRAFRRPLRDDERTWLEGIYADARVDRPAPEALAMLAETVLQAPPVLYREELGLPIDGFPDEIRRLDSYEVANRLSYLLWDTLPDDALFEAAAQDRLSNRDGLAEQLDRMLQDPRTETKLQELVWTWVRLDGDEAHPAFEDTTKDPMLFPAFTPNLHDAMRTELEALVSDVFDTDNGSFEALLTTRRAYVNRALADLYGVAGPLDDDDWQWVELPADQRSGLLTRAAFLSTYAGPRVQSPIRRGATIVERVLCQDLPPPPPNVNDVPPEGKSGDGAQSVREDVDAQTSTGECAGCHDILNPFGFALEHYDALGRWQTTEALSGEPVDSAVDVHYGGVSGSFEDATDLSASMATTVDVRQCMAQHWFEQALGGELGEFDQCEVDRVAERFAQTGDMRELIREIVLSDTFRFVNTSPVETE